MARTRKSKFHPRVPGLLQHSTGQARVTLSGRVYYLGAFGLAESHARYAALVARWEAGGRRPMENVETVESLASKTERVAAEFRIPTAAAEKVVGIAGKIGVSHTEAVAVAKLRHPDLFAPVGPSLREAVARYETHLDESGRYVKRGEPTSERAIIRKSLAEFVATHGDHAIETIDSSKIVDHRDALEKRAKLSRSGINRKLQVLRRAMAWFRERKIITRDQWLDVQDVRPLKRGELTADREKKHHKRAVPFADVEKVAEAAGRIVGAMLRLQMATGCRPGEVCGLRWQDIDKTPVMVGNVACWTWYVDGAKAASHHATTYAIGPAAQRVLIGFPAPPAAFLFSPRRAMQELHDERRSARATPPTTQMRRRDAAAKRPLAAKYDVGNYAQAVERAIERAKVDRFTPHEVRHAFVTSAARRFGVLAAKVAANHTDATTTAGYLHDDRADAYRVVVGLEQVDTVGLPAPAAPPSTSDTAAQAS